MSCREWTFSPAMTAGTMRGAQFASLALTALAGASLPRASSPCNLDVTGWQVGIYSRSADLTILLSLEEIVFRRARLCWSRLLPPQPIVNLFVNVVRCESIACLNSLFEKLAAAVDLG